MIVFWVFFFLQSNYNNCENKFFYYQLTADEEEKQRDRRERNCVAARKYRQRKRELENDLLKVSVIRAYVGIQGILKC